MILKKIMVAFIMFSFLLLSIESNKVKAEDPIPPDVNPPLIVIISPTPGFVSTTNQITCKGTIKDEESGIKEISVNYVLIYSASENGSKINTINFDVIASLQIGKNSIPVEALDQAGNRSIDFVDVFLEDRSKPPIIIEIWIGKLYAFIDKEFTKLEVAPTISNSRTIVPLRFIAEGFKAQVVYEPKTKFIKISSENIYILLQIDQKKAIVERRVDDQTQTQELILDVPPLIQKGRTLVPLRFIADAFRAMTDWNPQEEKITITLVR